MRKSVVISLVFHLSLTLLIFQWVSFREVNYVPRQVYNVTLVSAAAAESKSVVAPAPEPERASAPVKEEKKEDEMVVPPEKPKAPPKKADKEKTVPTTRIQKSDSLSGGAASDSAGQAPAAVAGGVSFDSGDFPFTYYVNRMRQKIAASWQVPAGSEGSERSSVVYFRVHRDGSVTHVKVEKSSELFLFDQSCQRAVLEAAPMPPLPREFHDEYLGVHFSFVYLPMQ
jgi:TonB family protein